MRTYHFLILSFLALWLTSCATVTPSQPVAQNQRMSWDSRVATLSRIQSWSLKGLIGIREPQKSAVSATIQWQQQQQSYHIALYGPLGTNSYELTGRPGYVQLAGANGKQASARSAEELLAKEVGWYLPVSNLYYWIRGIPVPNVPAQKQVDGYNHLIQLNQQGWSIQFLSYTSVNHIDIPNRITFSNPRLNVKLVINQWRF